jgi:cytochrome c5
MKDRIVTLALFALFSCAAACSLFAQKDTKAPAARASIKKEAVHVDAGEQAFQANCSRCHYAPEQLPPQITGTVVRHMRVRANLSAEDEHLILHFLNP